MSSLKRKEGPGGSSASKSARPTTESRPSKRPKATDTPKDHSKAGAKKGKDHKAQKQSKNEFDKPVAAPMVSLLKEDEPLFPRGGGSVLTPLEQQEIQVQAKKDALFEEQSGTTGGKSDKSGKRKKRKSEAEETTTIDPDAVKIESLNFKVCVRPGAPLLAHPLSD